MSATRHFLTDLDFTPDEQSKVLDLAAAMKADKYGYQPYAGPQTVAVFFDKTSTRTRVSFHAGIAELGGSPLIINSGESQLGHKESIADSAKVLERMVSTIVWRTYAQSGLEEMAANSSVPVINALSDDYHPCQLIADLLTVREHKGKTAGLIMSYLGDAANNMANSYLLAGVTAGMHVRIAGPEGYLPSASIIAAAQERAALTGGSVTITTDAAAALEDADVVVTDTWVSMGQEDEKEARLKLFTDYSVSTAAMKLAKDDAIVLHCLPAYRGYEIDAEVIDGPQSVVFDEAENRVHAQKAVMAWLMVASGLAEDSRVEL
ncbi:MULTISPECIES: ornithine carbamoyltransferase [Glutamicibacter]|uniref:Ornithine carbamoyltransferase n=1 Tax=Glutamicibacter halophytocola TaxID=1933880 RepID=A0A5B8J142_9MICC|nr:MULTISPECIES: ornithine carbamoyltransferase [Glutamicibacter]ALG28595.1 ornithine carbamoyltransferase [Glutamicibacter halophytocola]MBF6670939.1 ornithine carbamoyltransferase [Glutamicibacter sp. FBE19]NQD41965.1 ornithine carbamoyltransferase [Glutamicibacter halophytocola]QDY67890.1 ornithine carbamoyltransferase [Glutamicibacter halophytocola]UUX60070.1 ornithine carbamoyltransferase [Glutamicibacter halophytocola]